MISKADWVLNIFLILKSFYVIFHVILISFIILEPESKKWDNGKHNGIVFEDILKCRLFNIHFYNNHLQKLKAKHIVFSEATFVVSQSDKIPVTCLDAKVRHKGSNGQLVFCTSHIFMFQPSIWDKLWLALSVVGKIHQKL